MHVGSMLQVVPHPMVPRNGLMRDLVEHDASDEPVAFASHRPKHVDVDKSIEKKVIGSRTTVYSDRRRRASPERLPCNMPLVPVDTQAEAPVL